jgi:hypothetical protein
MAEEVGCNMKMEETNESFIIYTVHLILLSYKLKKYAIGQTYIYMRKRGVHTKFWLVNLKGR